MRKACRFGLDLFGVSVLKSNKIDHIKTALIDSIKHIRLLFTALFRPADGDRCLIDDRLI